VTIQASPVSVRADSISTMDITLPRPNRLERHSGFVRAWVISKRALDLLRLPSTLVPLHWVHVIGEDGVM
jgi:hypothetical protein